MLILDSTRTYKSTTNTSRKKRGKVTELYTCVYFRLSIQVIHIPYPVPVLHVYCGSTCYSASSSFRVAAVLVRAAITALWEVLLRPSVPPTILESSTNLPGRTSVRETSGEDTGEYTGTAHQYWRVKVFMVK